MGHEKTDLFDQDSTQGEKVDTVKADAVTYKECFAKAAGVLDAPDFATDLTKIALATEWRQLGLAIVQSEVNRHREGLR